MSRLEKDAARAPLCRGCKHYYVTWDPKLPHGCKAHHFKSKDMPDKEVFQASQMICELFEKRPVGKPTGPS